MCPRCQTKNAAFNRACIKCGRNMTYDALQSDSSKKKSNLYIYIMERVFSSVLMGCAVVSIFFALMAYLEQPAFTIFSFLE